MREPPAVSDLHLPSHDACEALTAVVNDPEVQTRAGQSRVSRYAKGRCVWNAADLPDRVFRLESGRVHVVGLDADGQEYLYQAVTPGEIFGEMCFCDHRHEPHGTEARCVTESTVWAMSYRDFRRAAQRGNVVDAIVQAFCTRVGELEQRALMLAEHDARRRLARLLLDLAGGRVARGSSRPPTVTLTISHADLAVMAALSRPHVSVLMTEFRRRRLVSYRRGGPLSIRTVALRRMIGERAGD